MTETLDHPAADGLDLPTLWAIPVGEPSAAPSTPAAGPLESPTFSLAFPGAGTPPPVGFTPRLSRDNELG